MSEAIALDGVGVRLGRTQILQATYARAPEGSVVTVTGRSGAGKSTLLNVVGGLLRVSMGRLSVCGTDLGGTSDRRRSAFRAAYVGFVFQSAHLVPWLTSLENVQVGGAYRQIRRPSITDCQEILDRVGLSHRLNHRPGQLSGGERQRVAVARALVFHPRLLLADEPTGNLDAESSVTIVDMLMSAAPKATVMIVTHDPALAAKGQIQWVVEDRRVAEVVRELP